MKKSDSENISLVFIGKGIFPARIASDKNFLLDLSDEFNNMNIKTYYISLSELPSNIQIKNYNNYYFIKRPLHFFNSKKFFWYDKQNNLIAYHHSHKQFIEFIEILLTILFNVKTIRKILKNIDGKIIINWMDFVNIAPILKLLIGNSYKYVLINLRYIHESKIKEKLKITSLNHADAIIVGTNAMKDILIEKGCKSKIIEPCSWGIKDKKIISDENEKNNRKLKILWSGYIQQIGYKEFLETINFVSKIVMYRKDIDFYFLFKPESYDEDYKKYEKPNIIIEKVAENFLNLLKQYDCFFCPLINNEDTLAPPLTWIESLSLGLPIITTYTRGVDEIIENKKSGFIFKNWDEMEQWFLNDNIFEEINNAKKFAREEYLKKYEIKIIAKKYVNIYLRLIND